MKFVLILAALCALFAFAMGSALPNSADAGVVEERAPRRARETCDPRACNQFCQRLGFPGGACINNGTKCDCDRW